MAQVPFTINHGISAFPDCILFEISWHLSITAQLFFLPGLFIFPNWQAIKLVITNLQYQSLIYNCSSLLKLYLQFWSHRNLLTFNSNELKHQCRNHFISIVASFSHRHLTNWWHSSIKYVSSTSRIPTNDMFLHSNPPKIHAEKQEGGF